MTEEQARVRWAPEAASDALATILGRPDALARWRYLTEGYELDARTLQRPVVFYHLWAGDEHHGANWLPPANEFFTALESSRFDGDVRVGVVGGPEQQGDAARWLQDRRPDWECAAIAHEGYEMVTLHALHQFAKAAHPGTPVLYAHGKGSFGRGEFRDRWRQAMITRAVADWRHCVNSLHSHDAVGCHWLTREEFPGKIGQPGVFGGNFWWANAGYLAGLPPIDPFGTARHAAEGWVGLNDPKVECLVPGWPAY